VTLNPDDAEAGVCVGMCIFICSMHSYVCLCWVLMCFPPLFLGYGAGDALWLARCWGEGELGACCVQGGSWQVTACVLGFSETWLLTGNLYVNFLNRLSVEVRIPIVCVINRGPD
jgi:hypothetical protein